MKNEDDYSSSIPYQTSPVELENLGFIRSQMVRILRVLHMQYITVTGKIRIIERFRVINHPGWNGIITSL